ncbi:MAG: hypothetical protein RL023_92 [Candidatus Parcubacteria bacterium]
MSIKEIPKEHQERKNRSNNNTNTIPKYTSPNHQPHKPTKQSNNINSNQRSLFLHQTIDKTIDSKENKNQPNNTYIRIITTEIL